MAGSRHAASGRMNRSMWWVVLRRGVRSWSIHQGGSQCGDAVGHLAFPALSFMFAVVVPADQREVVEVGESAVFPASDVVGFGPGGWGVAAGEAAAAVAGGERASLVGGGVSSHPPVTDDTAGVVEDDGDDIGLVDQVQGVGDADGLAVSGGGGAGTGGELLEGHGDDQDGGDAAVVGQGRRSGAAADRRRAARRASAAGRSAGPAPPRPGRWRRRSQCQSRSRWWLRPSWRWSVAGGGGGGSG